MVEKEYKQKDGDILIIIGRGIKKDYVFCSSKKYNNKFEAKKCHILNGCVINPEKDNFEFVGKTYPQSCGDNLLVVEKTQLKDKDNSFLFRCKFQKYPYEILLSNKQRIKSGKVNNPQIEQVEFINKEWSQKCGDVLRIVEKLGSRKWKCQFLKYSYEIVCEKKHILEGSVVNPQIEQIEFVGKEFKQNCGCYLRVLEKTNKKEGNNYLFRCRFLNSNIDIIALKTNILRGNIDNPSLPWKNKEFLENYLKTKFNKKPSLQEVSKSLGLAICTLGRKINEFGLRDYISYFQNYQENSIRDFIKQYTECSDKEENFNIEGKEYGLDIYLSKLNLGIEYNGNYWHSSLYKEPNYHQKKSLYFLKKDIKLIHIFEYEWADERIRPILESILKMNLGVFEKKIGASKCKIKELEYKEYAEFCNENHIQGEAGARVKLGLFYKEELIQVMSFGSPRFSDKYEYEIIRECSKKGYIVIGGKEKLWNYFVKMYNPISILSYCDFSKFTGNSYLKLGFKKERLNTQGFVWWDEQSKQVFWRNPYKNKEMKDKGYLKIYDCGQLVFGWFKKN